jgi:hypothetical protein
MWISRGRALLKSKLASKNALVGDRTVITASGQAMLVRVGIGPGGVWITAWRAMARIVSISNDFSIATTLSNSNVSY